MPTIDNLPASPQQEKVLPVYRRLLAGEGITIRFSRLIYSGGGTSGDTHASGDGHDFSITDPGPHTMAEADKIADRIARQMGIGQWTRQELWRDGKRVWPKHHHGIINRRTKGNTGLYQVNALNAGFNGLGAGGMGGLDDGPRDGIHWPLRTMTKGIEWARNQEDDMFEPDDRRNLSEIETIVRRMEKRIGGTADMPNLTRLALDLSKAVAALPGGDQPPAGGGPSAAQIADELARRLAE